MSGILIQRYTDKLISNDIFTRSSNNVIWSVDMRKKIILNVKIKTKFNSVSPKKVGKTLDSFLDNDPRYGTIDLETYMNNNKPEVYAIGLHTNYVEDSPVMFYLHDDVEIKLKADDDKKDINVKQKKKKVIKVKYDKNNIEPKRVKPTVKIKNSVDLILKLIDTILTTKYDNKTWYIHNFGGYDASFIVHTLVEVNRISINKGKGEIYKLNTTFRDDKIIKLSIRKDRYTMNIVDSYAILGFSLHDLCIAYKTDVSKYIFPYRFMTEKTLHYEGNKPGLEYWDKPDNMKQEEFLDLYNAIPSDNWNARTVTLDYLNKDLISLHEVLTNFSDQIYHDYDVQVTNSLTISGLALEIYLRKYHNNNIPLINRKGIFEDIKKSYYGGITEVYIPTNANNEELYYYDVNSLYPYASLNPMPGLESTYEKDINRVLDLTNDYCKELFGFFYCTVEANDNYLGLLPHKKDGSIICPKGTWEGWYFSEEIKFASANGYKIFLKKGHHFNKEANVFDKYVKDLYYKKSNSTNPSEIAVSKSLLNNLIGRFGLSLDKDITEIFDVETLNDLMQTKRIKSYKNIGSSDQYLVSYNNNVDLEICEYSGVDYISAYVENLKTKSRSKSKISSSDDTYRNVSIVISSAVNSYARIYMQTIKLEILKRGDLIYYTDTDSLITNKAFDDKLIGGQLGQFKLVDTITKLYAISGKSYAYTRIVNDDINKKDEVIIKFKGISSKSVDFDNIRDLYYNKDIKATRFESNVNYAEGFTEIKKSTPIELSHDMYKKRSKIYDDKGLWINTSPVDLSEVNSSSTEMLQSNVLSKFILCFTQSKARILKYKLIAYEVWQWQKKSITWFDILSINGSIYYSDTDNIVTNVVLPDKLVGKSRGQLKLEYTIKKAYFISSKTCCFKVLFFFIIKFCYKLCYHMGYLSLVSTFHKMVQTISSFLFAFYIEGGVAIIVKKKFFRCDTFVLYTNKLTVNFYVQPYI